jgi:ATP-dependent Clp protease adapter protein ClpS
MSGLRDALARAWRRVVGPPPPLRVDADVELALHVATREAQARGQAVGQLHLLHGLLRVDAVGAAIAKLGGDAPAMELHVLGELDRAVAGAGLDDDARSGLERAIATAVYHDRHATVAGVWVRLDRALVARAAAAGGIDARELRFQLVHGYGETDLDQPRLTDVVHVVIRNDDHTSMELVVRVLRETFALPEAEAIAVMRTAHETGKAIVGRFALDVARAKVGAARALADAHDAPLWIGLEDC